MIPLIVIDAKTDRCTALGQYLTGTGAYRVMASTSPEVTLSRNLIESPAVVLAVHDEGENGLLFSSGHVNELAAKVQPGQVWLKRVVAEMGGKDSIIVDSETDIDDAVKGVVTSAFGFQGQKCSACSRAIVDQSVYKEFVKKIKVEVEKIKVGPAEENYPAGPVINQNAEKGILNYIEIGKKEGKLLTGGVKVDNKGYFIAPTVIVDIKPEARISQEEIFGPVLAVIKSRNFEDSLKIANNTKFGLTGAVYTTNRGKLEKAKKELLIGNLYFNRKCTGALVGGHPFGGFHMSGTDSKAGGRDYLLLFMQGKLLSEKIGIAGK